MQPHVKSQYYLEKYYSFIERCKNRPVPTGASTEKHHIKPVSLFPDDEHVPENLVVLLLREHYLAHWMLAKAYGGKMWYAFNQMKRILPQGNQKKSALYAMSRIYISGIISKANTGRKMPDYVRNNMIKLHTGKVNARFSDGSVIRVSIDDLRFKTGEIKNARIGYKHNDSTKELMSQNGIKGKTVYNNGIDKIFLSCNDIVPNGYLKGDLDLVKERASDRFTDAKHYHHIITKEQVRSKDHPGDGWVEGRVDGFMQGNSIMNDPTKVKVFDLVDMKGKLVTKGSELETHISSGNSKMLIAGGYIFESLDLHLTLIPEVPVRNSTVPKPNYGGKQSAIRREFCKNNVGKLISEFPLEICKAKDWKGDYTQYKILTKHNHSALDIEKYKLEVFGIGTNNASSSNK